jgi:adenosylcobinamide-GDP ribazoletransferase
MSIAPYVGLALGLVVGGVGLGAVALGASPLVAAVLVIGASAGLTRGLHLDGLADTADGLGSYRDAADALQIMRKPDVGPFGVVVIVLVLLAQIASAAQLLSRPWLPALAGIATATAVGRLGISLACWHRIPAARPDGLGATVAGTVGVPALATGAFVLGAAALVATPIWLGPVALGAGLVAGIALLAQAVRRLGGVTGDVLGAVCEVTTTLTYVVMSL